LAKANYARDKEVAKTPGPLACSNSTRTRRGRRGRCRGQGVSGQPGSLQAQSKFYRRCFADRRSSKPLLHDLGQSGGPRQTLLTTVVSLDPMYVYFDIDEGPCAGSAGHQRWHDQALSRGRNSGPHGVAGEDEYQHKGTINFVNNQVNPNTGSISARGVFANRSRPTASACCRRDVRAGAVAIGQPQSAVLVIDRAIGSDQGLKFVYVVDAEARSIRRISTGPLQRTVCG